ncbi:hypothetical protein [Acidimangrovimonas pyrenivorans]|uniref:GS catalytic domain-containing protein n=1 Tax=Acidimangrovimonas pyrenivorans TaxID=2030798 RepID=A0ABV7ACG4_9RHOB
MAGNLSFEALEEAVAADEIDTILACIVDMQGRLMGKRFHAAHFVDSAWAETHCCNYLLATDLEMATVLAAGLAGIEGEMELEPLTTGDVYQAEGVQAVPGTLGEAARLMNGSQMLRAAFGDNVVEHYTRAALWEIEEQNRVVTDWELRRGLERA